MTDEELKEAMYQWHVEQALLWPPKWRAVKWADKLEDVRVSLWYDNLDEAKKYAQFHAEYPSEAMKPQKPPAAGE